MRGALARTHGLGDRTNQYQPVFFDLPILGRFARRSTAHRRRPGSSSTTMTAPVTLESTREQSGNEAERLLGNSPFPTVEAASRNL